MSKRTPSVEILTTTRTLSAAADRILAQARAGHLSKPALLNILAGAIAGDKHDWGFLTGHQGQVIDQRLRARSAPATEDRAPTPLPPEEGSVYVPTPTGELVLLVPTPSGATEIVLIAGQNVPLIHSRIKQGEQTLLTTSDLTLALLPDRRIQIDILSDAPFRQVLNTATFIAALERQMAMTGPSPKKPSANQQMALRMAADAALTGFITVAESDTEIAALMEIGNLTPEELDIAVRRAAAQFLGICLSSPYDPIAAILEDGRRSLINRIFDQDWTILQAVIDDIRQERPGT